MSIGRITGALAVATNEITLAAAALNFDFSLIKVEAPEEFKFIGGSLSEKRRIDAEDGKTHVVARKLGALFDTLIPPIPNLVKAYGLRASEIAASSVANPKPSVHDGPFAAHVGADGTTLWAAATSGRSAIAIHLLACLLARIWSGSEATSLWSEIVEKRRQEIVAAFENNEEIDIATLSIARQEFSRQQLAEWDASARGWLQAADIAKESELKQLLLIVKNIDMSVDRGINVYEGVMRVWKKALRAMESLVRGVPQAVSDGSILIAIWAWHLYPDLVILRSEITTIHFKDPLINTGSSLTIGLQIEDPERKQDGLYWSLSLSHLRYYGNPIASERAATRDASRLSFQDLTLVAFGSLVAEWGDSVNNTITQAEFFIALWECLGLAVTDSKTSEDMASVRGFMTCDSNWMKILVQAAQTIVDGDDTEHQTVKKLVKLGQRRREQFFQPHIPPYFHLTKLKNLLPLINREEDSVNVLREAVSNLGMKYISGATVPFLVRYTHGPKNNFEYASLSSESLTVTKGKPHETLQGAQRLQRWISVRNAESLAGFDDMDNIVMTVVDDESTRHSELEDLGEEVRSREDASIRSVRMYQISYGSPPIKYKYLLGDTKKAALFIPEESFNYVEEKYGHLFDDTISVPRVIQLLRFSSVRAHSLIELIWRVCSSTEKPSLQALPLRALSSAARVYKLLSRASISPNILLRPFHKARWNSNKNLRYHSGNRGFLDTFRGERLTRPQSFACIAMLESGIHDLDSAYLEPIMAMSSSNSIYVAAPLLCDPWESPHPEEICRITGNIGRAGLAMMFAPQNVQMKSRDNTRWAMVNHADFDGKPENNFKGTSLHLSFTGYERPLGASVAGQRDVEVFLLETRVSLHSEGIWLADLDILAGLQSPKVSRIVYGKKCSHSPDERPEWPITALDNWDEFFDPPENTAIVRAHRNWIARLAFVCVCHQLRREAMVMPEAICWKCNPKPTKSPLTYIW